MTPQNNSFVIVKYTEGVAVEVRALDYTIDLDSIDGLQLIGAPLGQNVNPADVVLSPVLSTLRTDVEALKT